MAKKKKKPSKRGMKARNKSLHCSSLTRNQEKKIRKWARMVKTATFLIKGAYVFLSVLKSFISLLKSLFDWLWSAL
jgi:hypothetical protein